jgi:hypothetical protein
MCAAYDNAGSGLPIYLLATEIIGYSGHDFAFAPYGAYWRALRKLCTLELLGARKVRQLASIGDSETMSLVREICRRSCSRGRRRRSRLGAGGDVLPVVSRVAGWSTAAAAASSQAHCKKRGSTWSVLWWQPWLAVERSQSDGKEKFIFLSASSGGSGRRSQKGRGSAVDVEGGVQAHEEPGSHGQGPSRGSASTRQQEPRRP